MKKDGRRMEREQRKRQVREKEKILTRFLLVLGWLNFESEQGFLEENEIVLVLLEEFKALELNIKLGEVDEILKLKYIIKDRSRY